MKASTKRACGVIKFWAQRITKHLYWTATSSQGDKDLATAKWRSILNHISNIHDGHGDVYPECEHDEITEPKEWIERGIIIFLF